MAVAWKKLMFAVSDDTTPSLGGNLTVGLNNKIIDVNSFGFLWDATPIVDGWTICDRIGLSLSGQGDVADDLLGMYHYSDVDMVFLRTSSGAIPITLKHNDASGNIWLKDGVDILLNDTKIVVCLVYEPNNSKWVDIGVPGAVMEADFNAQTILAATTDNTPAALTVAEQEVVGRLTGGNVDGIALGIADNNVVQVDGSPSADQVAVWTANGVEGDANLTFSGSDLALGANIGLTFGTGEKIEGDSTDLTITSGGKVNLNATNGVTLGSALNVASDNVSLVNMGTYDAGISVGALSDNTFAVTNNLSSTADDAYWLMNEYMKITIGTADQTNKSFANLAIRQDIGKPITASYGIQSHLTLSGTGTVSSEVVGISAQLTGTMGSTAGLQWALKADQRLISAGTDRGSSAAAFLVTTKDSGDIAYLENLSGATVQDGMYIHNAGTMANGIYMAGTMTDGIDLSGATLTNDIVLSGGATITSSGAGVAGTAIKDEDNMVSDSATHLATQQSIKKYVDDTVQGSYLSIATIVPPLADDAFIMFFTFDAITVSEIEACRSGGTSYTFQIWHDPTSATALAGGPNKVLDAAEVITADEGFTDAVMDDFTIPADSYVIIYITSVVGSVTQAHVTLKYTKD